MMDSTETQQSSASAPLTSREFYRVEEQLLFNGVSHSSHDETDSSLSKHEFTAVSNPSGTWPLPSGRDSALKSPIDSESPTLSLFKQAKIEPTNRKEVGFAQKASRTISVWRIGWATPLIMSLSYVVSFGLAIAHLVLFQYLDGRLVSKSIAQSYVSNLSVALARSCGILIAVSLTTAFTQLLWHHLRRKKLKLGTIDALFFMTSRPGSLRVWNVWRRTPDLCLFAVAVLLVPIALVFPPGALIVDSAPISTLSEMPILIYDPTCSECRTPGDFARNIFFSPTTQVLTATSSIPSNIGPRMLVNGRFTESSSPCGQNCSFDVALIGAGLECSYGLVLDIDYILAESLEAQGFIGGQYQALLKDHYYLAEQGNSTDIVNGTLQEVPRIDFEWDTPSKNMSCLMLQCIYLTHIRFSEGIEVVEMVNKSCTNFNATLFTDGMVNYAMYSSVFNSSYPDYLHPDIDIYAQLNIFAMHENYLNEIIGTVGTSLDNNTTIWIGDIVTASQLVTVNQEYYLNFTISPDVLEELAFNMTISMQTMAATNVTTNVTSIEYLNIYVFAHQLQFYLSYGLTLLISLLLLLAGGHALIDNGVAADSSFLQVLCTTAASDDRIRTLAKAGCLGGSENIPKELKELVVSYGHLGQGAEQGDMVAGFGVEGTVTMIRRGETYGHL